jgi:AcrR family transcriptional regulator
MQRYKDDPLKKAKATQSAPAPLQAPNSRDAILDAALKAFARGGFEGASLPRIAAMAEVAPTLIHYYFGNKDKLWRETIDHSLGGLKREFNVILNATRALAPLDRLRALLQAIIHFAARQPDHFAMIMAEARAGTDRFAWVQAHYTGVLFREVISLLRQARDLGQIRDVALDQVAMMLVGGILARFSVDPTEPDKRDVAKLADEYTELMFAMLLDGLARRPGHS